MTDKQLRNFSKKVHFIDGCMIWTGALDGSGYGSVNIGTPKQAYRVAYEHWIGSIPDGLELDHKCRNRKCVSPAHLEPVTHRENTLRGNTFVAINAAKTHCPHGHPYDIKNTYRNKSGRHCRACHTKAKQRYRIRKRARLVNGYSVLH